MTTKKIKGNFIIMKNGKMYIGKRMLRNSDKIYLSIKKIKQIISDAKKDLI